MKKVFFLKLFLVLLPVLSILCLYLYKDPFKVLYHYDNYFDYAPNEKEHLTLNLDFVSTETLLGNYAKYQPDSYIFGSSRSMFYLVDEWSKHIDSKRCYHYDANMENLFGIEGKFRLLEKRGIKIKNALIIFDPTAAQTTNLEGHLFKKNPRISGQNPMNFQINCFQDFLDMNFLPKYIKFLWNGKPTEEMINSHLLSTIKTHYVPASNEITFSQYDSLLEKNRDSFYAHRMSFFYKRDSVQKYYPPCLGPKQKELLSNIRRILDKDHTSYRLVISPLYDQKKMDAADLDVLYAIFGKQNVFDFSGINDITSDFHNYYEDSHYRPFIANRIMDSIYAHKQDQIKN